MNFKTYGEKWLEGKTLIVEYKLTNLKGKIRQENEKEAEALFEIYTTICA